MLLKICGREDSLSVQKVMWCIRELEIPAAPKATPADRIVVLRAALAAAAKDPEFLAEMEKRQLPVQYRSGDQLQAFVKQALTTTPEAVKAFLDVVGPQ